MVASRLTSGADVGWGGCSHLTNGGGFRARRPYAVLSGILLVRHERTCPAKSSSCPDSNERLVWKASGYPSLKSSVTRKPPISRVQEMGGGSIAKPFLLGLLLEMPSRLLATAGLFALRGIVKTPGAAHYPSSACRALAETVATPSALGRRPLPSRRAACRAPHRQGAIRYDSSCR